jgi:hypothetical protein
MIKQYNDSCRYYWAASHTNEQVTTLHGEWVGIITSLISCLYVIQTKYNNRVP